MRNSNEILKVVIRYVFRFIDAITFTDAFLSSGYLVLGTVSWFRKSRLVLHEAKSSRQAKECSEDGRSALRS